MKTKKLIFLALLFLYISQQFNAQECDCTDSFEWMKKTFEENDAGFQHSLEIKGKEAYDIHNNIYREKVKKISDSSECTNALNGWLTFFRKGHIGIRRITSLTKSSSAKKEIKKIERDIREINIDEFTRYLNSDAANLEYESIWQMGNYKIAIGKEGANWVGRVIETKEKNWLPGEKKLEIMPKGRRIEAVYITGNHIPDTVKKVKMWGKTILSIPPYATMNRIYPKMEMEEDVKSFLMLMGNRSANLVQLNENTLYLRIPNFDINVKPQIDSVIKASQKEILSTKNLIIDLRYNGGGSDDSYAALLPIIYTNPIRNIGVEFLSTKLNNQRMIDFSTNPKYKELLGKEQIEQFEEDYKKLEKHIGEFVNLRENEVDFTYLDTVNAYPQHIGIIVDNNSASTTEQFLLAAKQSTKVKLFGVSTQGSLDISNMYHAKSPCGNYELRYCLSRSLRIPGMMIDDVGIQPDYYIDNSIPEYKWIEFVKETLNANSILLK